MGIICELTAAPISSLNPGTPLMDAGVDSLAAERFASGVLTRTGLVIEPTAIFEHPTAEAVAMYLARRLGLRTPSVWAISQWGSSVLASACLSIGAAVQRWPGCCTQAEELDTLLHGGGDALGSPPSQHWVLEDEVDVHTLSSGQRTCIQHGGYIDAERFDGAAFHLSPAEVGWMDPQQRLLLEVGFQSLHAHGMRRRLALRGSDTGHFLGMSKADWSRYQFARRGGYANYSVYATTCDSNTVASGRLSFALGMHGPCMTPDSAPPTALEVWHEEGWWDADLVAVVDANSNDLPPQVPPNAFLPNTKREGANGKMWVVKETRKGALLQAAPSELWAVR